MQRSAGTGINTMCMNYGLCCRYSIIDCKKISSYQATLGQEETIELSRENW